MSEEKMMTKLGRSTVEDLKARADRFDMIASGDLAQTQGTYIYNIRHDVHRDELRVKLICL